MWNMRARQSRSAHAALSTSNSGAWAGTRRRNASTIFARRSRFRCGAEACWNPASGARTMSRCQRWRISPFRETSPRAGDTGPKRLSNRKWKSRDKVRSGFQPRRASAIHPAWIASNRLPAAWKYSSNNLNLTSTEKTASIEHSVVDSHSRAQRPSTLFLASMVTLMLMLWSFNYVAGKIALRHMDPISLACFRIELAAVIMSAIYFSRQRRATLQLRDAWPFAYLGLFGVVINQGLFTVGLNYTTSNHSAVIIAIGPVIVLLLARAMKLEALT